MVLLLLALFLPGEPPKTDDSIDQLVSIFAEKRRLLLISTFIAAVGALAFVWFLGSLHDHLRPAGAGLASIAVASGVMAVGFTLAGVAVTAGLVLSSVSIGDAATVRALADTTNVLIELSKVGLASLLLAVAAAGLRGSLGRRMRVLGVAIALLLIASALPPFLADSGVWQFGGGVELAPILPAAIWVIVLSVRLAFTDAPKRPSEEQGVLA